MVVMSFMVENLAPVPQSVNGIVQMMHRSDINWQRTTHSILCAVATNVHHTHKAPPDRVGLVIGPGGPLLSDPYAVSPQAFA